MPGLWQVPISYVNAFLLDAGDGLTLIDTGLPGSAPEILAAVKAIGKTPEDVRRIVVTHCHKDHAGSLHALIEATNAPASMHPEDAEMVRVGKCVRPLTPSPGLFNSLLFRLVQRSAKKGIDPAKVEHEVNDGDTLPGGLRAIHVPGHCAGQLAFLWTAPDRRVVLIAADAASNMFGRLALSPFYEDHDLGRRSLARLSAETFEVAVFGHGRPILKGASARFGEKWPAMRA